MLYLLVFAASFEESINGTTIIRGTSSPVSEIKERQVVNISSFFSFDSLKKGSWLALQGDVV